MKWAASARRLYIRWLVWRARWFVWRLHRRDYTPAEFAAGLEKIFKQTTKRKETSGTATNRAKTMGRQQ
jgi:hypothetical protein